MPNQHTALPAPIRFARRAGPPIPPPPHVPSIGPCRLWQGSTFPNGYGQFHFKGRPVNAHRYSFFLAHGRWPTPDGLHRCDRKLCVEQSHIFEGTQADNMHDMIAKGRKVVAVGERHGSVKLTASDVRAIQAARGTASQRKIGLRYGVSQALISLILRGKVWQHLG